MWLVRTVTKRRAKSHPSRILIIGPDQTLLTNHECHQSLANNLIPTDWWKTNCSGSDHTDWSSEIVRQATVNIVRCCRCKQNEFYHLTSEKKKKWKIKSSKSDLECWYVCWGVKESQTFYSTDVNKLLTSLISLHKHPVTLRCNVYA